MKRGAWFFSFKTMKDIMEWALVPSIMKQACLYLYGKYLPNIEPICMYLQVFHRYFVGISARSCQYLYVLKFIIIQCHCICNYWCE
jgi:hypothetical protein